MKLRSVVAQAEASADGEISAGTLLAQHSLVPFVPHPAAVRVLRALSWLRRNAAGLDRPKCLHLAAESGMGKSRLLRYYMSQMAAESAASGLRRREVILVEAPFDGHHRKLARAIIDACLPGYPVNRTSSAYDVALMLMDSSGVKQILIDEAGNFLNAGRGTQQQTLAFLKAVSNRGMTVCIATTRNMVNVLAADEQLQSRFNRADLPAWKESREFRQFLAGLEQAIALPSPSHLDSMAVVKWLLVNDCSTTARLVELIVSAAAIAKREGLPCLTLQALERAQSLAIEGGGVGHEAQ